MTLASRFGALVRQQRLAQGLSIRGLARQLGLSHVFVREVERGARPSIGEAHWPALADALRLTVDQLREAARRSVSTRFDLRDASPVEAAVLTLFIRRIVDGTLGVDALEQIRRVLVDGGAP